MDKTSLYKFLAGQRYGVIASRAADGYPQSALVGIAVTEDFEIVFDTVESSRKFSNLVERPHCSLVIGWSDEQTVQYEGRAWRPEGESLKRYQEIYFAAWPGGSERLSWAGIAYFVIAPDWLRFSKYDRSPPSIEEIAFPHEAS